LLNLSAVEYIRFALGFANAGQIGGNYCEQNASSTDQYRVRGVGLLEFGRHVSYKVDEKVIKFGFYVI
jgi:hypothetical protein